MFLSTETSLTTSDSSILNNIYEFNIICPVVQTCTRNYYQWNFSIEITYTISCFWDIVPSSFIKYSFF